MTQQYPLQWPVGWPRTKPDDRKSGSFAQRGASPIPGSSSRPLRSITLHQAIGRVLDEVSRFTPPGKRLRIDPDDVVLSTNLEIRKSDGLPKSGQRAPEDPGAALYFMFDGHPRVVPCDRYTTVEQNVAGIAATLDALRALERHGSGIMERAFTGFEALPHLVEPAWWEVLEVPEDAMPWVVTQAYQKLRSQHHPDRGGDPYQFDRVVKAYAAWEQENGS